jgi:hypothetical protein
MRIALTEVEGVRPSIFSAVTDLSRPNAAFELFGKLLFNVRVRPHVASLCTLLNSRCTGILYFH